MKITFFKNESHFYPRISYTWENAEELKLSRGTLKARICLSLILLIPFVAYLYLFLKNNTDKFFIGFAIIILTLPLHELCHALYCVIIGRKVERISFFPYKSLLAPEAYVVPSFNSWKKHQAILLSAFPLILMSALPAILAVFDSPLRPYLLILSLSNISTAAFDIIDIIHFIQFPKDSIYFIHFSLKEKDVEQPIVIHQLSITPKLDKINHRQFEYFEGKLTEKENVTDTTATEQLKKEFIAHFNL